MAPALAQMTDSWWLAYGEECICGVAGDACAQLHHAVEADERQREVSRDTQVSGHP